MSVHTYKHSYIHAEIYNVQHNQACSSNQEKNCSSFCSLSFIILTCDNNNTVVLQNGARILDRAKDAVGH